MRSFLLTFTSQEWCKRQNWEDGDLIREIKLVAFLKEAVLSENRVPWAGDDEAAESFTRPGMVGPSSLGPSGVHRTAPGSPLALSDSASVTSTSLPAMSDSPLISSATNVPLSAFISSLPGSLFLGDPGTIDDLPSLGPSVERYSSPDPVASTDLSEPLSPDFDTFLKLFFIFLTPQDLVWYQCGSYN